MALASDAKNRQDELREQLRRKYVGEILKRVDEFYEYVQRGDAVQASEKIYRAAEEFVKLMAELKDIPEAREANFAGRWTRGLLFSASEKLDLTSIFDTADVLHVEGFHERSMSLENVRKRGKKVADEIIARLKAEGLA